VSGRRKEGRRASRRQRLRRLLGAALLLGGASLLFFRWRGEGARARAERAGAERALSESRAHSRRAALEEKRAGLARALARIQGPPARAAELLAALARATPADIALREVACEEDGFTLRGHDYDAADGLEASLLRFRRDLCPATAPWQLSDPGPAGADFTWHGSWARPGIPEGEPDALEAQLAAARAALRPAEACDAWMREWSGHWKILARSAEHWPELELRHYLLTYAQPRLRAWSDIVKTLQLLGAQPGLTVDHLILAGAPEGTDAFSRAEISLTARLRP
jgi:hypothetical protein